MLQSKKTGAAENWHNQTLVPIFLKEKEEEEENKEGRINIVPPHHPPPPPLQLYGLP